MFDHPTPEQSDSHAKERVTIVENGEYIFYPHFLNKTESDSYFQNLRSNIIWKQESMMMYGKSVAFPRLTAWYGNTDKPYSFSGITLQPHPWSSDILSIKTKLESVAHVEFNSVLLNLYRDGKDSVSWHTDAEKELGTDPVIASVNFGATRKFQLRHTKTKEKRELELTHGSLLIMQGALQHFWQHRVAKTTRAVGERINLTFRVIR
jgi:alkylated DNA repair dioxygenase AlkB